MLDTDKVNDEQDHKGDFDELTEGNATRIEAIFAY